MSTIRLSAIGLGSRVLVLALTFLSSIVIARAVGPAGMGEYFVVLTTGALIATFCDLGLSSSAVVFSGERQQPLHVIGFVLLATALVVPLFAAAVVYAVYPSPAIWGHSTLSTVAVVLLGPMTLFNNYWTFLLVGRKEIAVSNAFQLVTYVVFTGALVTLRATGTLTIREVLLCHLAIFGAQMIAQATLLAAWRRRDASRPSGNVVDLLRSMIRFGLPAYPSTVATVFSLRIGVLMLSNFQGLVASGIYSVAFQIADKLQLVGRSIQDAIYDNMIVLKGRAAVEALNRYFRASMVLFAAITAVAIALAPIGLRVFYGRQYLASIPPFQILIVGSAAFAMASILSTYFVGQIKRPVILSIIACLNAVVATFANWLLIPSMAANGAALATSISQIAVLITCVFVYRSLSASDLRSVLLFSRTDARVLRDRLMGLP